MKEKSQNAVDSTRDSLSSYIRTVWDYLQVIIVAFILVFGFIRPFIVEAFKIPSGSMEDTLLVGDRILVCKFIYGIKVPGIKYRLFDFHKPQRGDVIVFVPPHDRKKNFIKRLVAIPGDTVETKNLGKDLYINGQLANDGYTKHKLKIVRSRYGVRLAREYEAGEYVDVSDYKNRQKIYKELRTKPFGFMNYNSNKEIPEGYGFAMGDNRDNSYDSRGWGLVDVNDIKGQAFMIYWSYDSTKNGWNIFKKIRFGRIASIIHSQKIIDDEK